MGDQTHPTTTTTSSAAAATPATEPVRSRWTPKPEQILILESIFNSGMVNPPKDETVRIRKLLEQYGPVGDANVFYWFQNRRSRSRRRQRQLQAASLQLQPPPPPPNTAGGAVFEYGGASSSSPPVAAPLLLGFQNSNSSNNNNIIMSSRSSTAASFQVAAAAANASPEYEFKDDSSGGGLSLSAAHMGFLPPQDNPNCFPYHLPPGGFLTVFVNGVATQVPGGSFDVKSMFGEGVLVHSTGVPVPVNEFGITLHSLHHGDTYFLVPRLA